MAHPHTTATLTDGTVTLEPLREDHAAEMTLVLADASLYKFTGGEPPSLESLRQRYVRQVRGVSPAGDDAWLNWIIRDTESSAAVGYVQATIPLNATRAVASLAWLVNPTYQGRGSATRATFLVIAALRTLGVTDFRASIAGGHVASERVAERLGLRRTDELDDGEVVWCL